MLPIYSRANPEMTTSTVVAIMTLLMATKAMTSSPEAKMKILSTEMKEATSSLASRVTI
jgi:hypothetical protein